MKSNQNQKIAAGKPQDNRSFGQPRPEDKRPEDKKPMDNKTAEKSQQPHSGHQQDNRASGRH